MGKTYLAQTFGAEHFESVVSINFELQPQCKPLFDELNPQDIINKIELLLNVTITPGKTLLFLDEIQECPQAIRSLRYFKELAPDYHVIAAGSLLEFAIETAGFGVGRVQSLYLRPLSFGEFLTASGETQLRNYLHEITLKKSLSAADPIHQKLLNLIRTYLLVGGMPAVVTTYLSNPGKFREVQVRQSNLLAGYRDDFGKYARKLNPELLEQTFRTVPRLVGQNFKYAAIEPEKARDIKKMLQSLEKAGLMYRVYATAASGVPLGAQLKETKFKVFFLDVGLTQQAYGLEKEILLSNDITQINAGGIAEQLVCQELLAYSDPYLPPELYYWVREKRSSSAEVDFVLSSGAKIIPIEVKAGKTGRLRSLQVFLDEKKQNFGIRISQQPVSFEHRILSLPLYMIEHLPRLIAGL